MDRILIIEDNADLRVSLVQYLKNEGFHVIHYPSAEDAISNIQSGGFDLGLIDINLPGKSGFEVINEIRDLDFMMPLIALTARDSIHDKVRGFETGLTDYIVKPFSLAELTARIRAHLKSNKQEPVIKTKSLQLIPERREVEYNGKQLQLTATEFRLLSLLARNSGKIVTMDDLIVEGWGEADRYSDPPLRIHIRNIRSKLEDKNCTFIKSVTGSGYMLRMVYEFEGC